MAAVKSHLLIEPFNSGSHKQLIDILLKHVPGTFAITLPGKKWHWKARTSALLLSQTIPANNNYRSLFASSVLNLAELVALRPDLARLHKILYFHENQLVYPVRRELEHDFQFGYNQILSSLVADVVLFNSKYNQESFLTSIKSFLNLIPYERPREIAEQIRLKCHVLHFPIVCLDSSADEVNVELGKEMVMDTRGEQDMTACRLVHVSNEARELLDSSEQKGTVSNYEADNTAGSKETEKCTCGTAGTAIENDKSTTEVDSKLLKQYTCKHRCDPTKTLHGKTSNCDDAYKDMSSVNTDVNPLENASMERGDSLNVLEDMASNVSKKPRYEDKGSGDSARPLHIVWPHRWEHDKGPDVLFPVLYQLQDAGVNFTLSVLGEQFTEQPTIFEEAQKKLQDKIAHWGYLESKAQYYSVLRQADCVVSTANHEFFGVAMIEAVHFGCYPLCPNRLVYPEIFPKEYLYNTDNQLFKKLREFCRKPHIVRNHKCKVDTRQYGWQRLKDSYIHYITMEKSDCHVEKKDNS